MLRPRKADLGPQLNVTMLTGTPAPRASASTGVPHVPRVPRVPRVRCVGARDCRVRGSVMSTGTSVWLQRVLREASIRPRKVP